MYTMIYKSDEDTPKKGKEAQIDMDTLLDEQEWLNFKLGLFAEY
jgi:hypothetical protein